MLFSCCITQSIPPGHNKQTHRHTHTLLSLFKSLCRWHMPMPMWSIVTVSRYNTAQPFTGTVFYLLFAHLRANRAAAQSLTRNGINKQRQRKAHQAFGFVIVFQRLQPCAADGFGLACLSCQDFTFVPYRCTCSYGRSIKFVSICMFRFIWSDTLGGLCVSCLWAIVAQKQKYQMVSVSWRNATNALQRQNIRWVCVCVFVLPQSYFCFTVATVAYRRRLFGKP